MIAKSHNFSNLSYKQTEFFVSQQTIDVLIVQDPNSSGQYPKPNANGGRIIFQFDSPVYFSDIGLLDADETQARLIITYADALPEAYKFTSSGDNSVQRVIASKMNVIKFEVLFVIGSGAHNSCD